MEFGKKNKQVWRNLNCIPCTPMLPHCKSVRSLVVIVSGLLSDPHVSLIVKCKRSWAVPASNQLLKIVNFQYFRWLLILNWNKLGSRAACQQVKGKTDVSSCVNLLKPALWKKQKNIARFNRRNHSKQLRTEAHGQLSDVFLRSVFELVWCYKQLCKKYLIRRASIVF